MAELSKNPSIDDYNIIEIPVYNEIGERAGNIRYLSNPAWRISEKVYVLEDDVPFINFKKLREFFNSNEVQEEIIDFSADRILVKRGSENSIYPYRRGSSGNFYMLLTIS